MPAATIPQHTLPEANSPELFLDHPTEDEKLRIWNMNYTEWNGGLSKADYIEREKYLTTQAPLARHGGITFWILVERGSPLNERLLLASSESIRKRTLGVAKNGDVRDSISHGIGSVFCNPEYRGRGYGKRMMIELGNVLRSWQGTQETPVMFSALWSDIGKTFYAGFGWHPHPSTHVEFPAFRGKPSMYAKALVASDLKVLCDKDEILIRQQLAMKGTRRVAVIPDHDQMCWHHYREDFLCQKFYGKQVK
jgi:GNAT superfamily N-acetyltransferase